MAGNITMLDAAVTEQKPLRKAIIMAMFKGKLPSPMDALPVVGATSLTQQIVRMTDPGTPTTRNINEAVSAYKAQFTTGTETLKIIENKVTIDKVLLEQSYVQGQDPITLQTKAYGETVKLTVNDLLVNGDPATTDSDPAGIQYRFANDALFLNQTINAAGLDVDNNDANRLAWLDHVDNAITLVRGVGDIAIVNRQTWIKFRSALRVLKLLDTTKDQFDRVIMVYGNTRFYDAGMKPAGALTGTVASQVIGDDTQTDVHGNASSTPMYFLNLQEEDGVRLLQLHPLRVSKLGIDAGSPADFVIDVTWPIGFLTPQKFCITSVQGLNIT